MEFLDPNLVASKKFRRRHPEMTNEEFNEYNKNLSKSDYGILRAEPIICKLIKKVHNNELDQKSFPFIENIKMTKNTKTGQKKKGAAINEGEFYRNDVLENPRIFVFVFGGLSHHEIASISNL